MPIAVRSYLPPSPVLARENGLKYEDGKVIFPDGTTREKAAQVMNRITGRAETFDATRTNSYTPDQLDISTVERLMLSNGGVKPDVSKFAFYKLHASNTMLNDWGEMLTKELLDEYARQFKATATAPGRTAMFLHSQGIPVGGTFDAYTEPMPGNPTETQLVIKCYVTHSATFSGGQSAIEAINDGRYRRISIAYNPGKVEYKNMGSPDAPRYIGILGIDPTGQRPSRAIEVTFCPLGVNNEAITLNAHGAGDYTFEEVSNLKKNITMKYPNIIGGKEYVVEVTEGDKPAMIGLTEVVSYANSLHADGLTKDKTILALQAEIKSIREPFENGIKNLQDKLKQAKDTDAVLAAHDLLALQTKYNSLLAQDEKTNRTPQGGSPKKGGEGEGEEEKTAEAKHKAGIFNQ